MAASTWAICSRSPCSGSNPAIPMLACTGTVVPPMRSGVARQSRMPRRHHRRLVHARGGHAEHELVPAEAPEDVVRAQEGLDPLGGDPEDLVAHGVAVGVVDVLEVVEVDHQDAVGLRAGVGGDGLEPAPAEQRR